MADLRRITKDSSQEEQLYLFRAEPYVLRNGHLGRQGKIFSQPFTHLPNSIEMSTFSQLQGTELSLSLEAFLSHRMKKWLILAGEIGKWSVCRPHLLPLVLFWILPVPRQHAIFLLVSCSLYSKFTRAFPDSVAGWGTTGPPLPGKSIPFDKGRGMGHVTWIWPPVTLSNPPCKVLMLAPLVWLSG